MRGVRAQSLLRKAIAEKRHGESKTRKHSEETSSFLVLPALLSQSNHFFQVIKVTKK